MPLSKFCHGSAFLSFSKGGYVIKTETLIFKSMKYASQPKTVQSF